MSNRMGRPWKVRPHVGAALLLLVPGVAAAQSGTVQGRVTDARSGAALVGVEVQVLERGVSARTDAEGRYRIAQVPAGSQVVEARLAGFRPEVRTAAVAAAGMAEVNFTLSPATLRTPQVDVIGPTAEALERIPGSASVVTGQELATRIPLSGNEVFRSIPGVHVQEEEGVGMRVNIGIRGLNPDRSRTVLMMEDGVPIALAAYGEPEMYYTPPIDRMARVEVIKGSGSILFGPQTIGGVVNYVTPDPRTVPGVNFDLRTGTGGLLHAQGQAGGSWGSTGAHLGALHKRADDLSGLFYQITDVTGKAVFALSERSEIGVKLSAYDEESNSTYVGLTDAMFRADPWQHPAPFDRLSVQRIGGAITHDWMLGSNALLRTTAYGHNVSRNWNRRDFRYVAENTQIEFLAGTGSRNRTFAVGGIEPRLQLNYWLGSVRNELDAGVRAHVERHEDGYVIGVADDASVRTLRDFELRDGFATAAFVQNRFLLNERFAITPGVRVESFRFDRNLRTARVGGVPTDVDARESDEMFEVIPGIGATFAPSDRLTLFAGAHRGFAPPRIKDAFVVGAGQGGVPELVSLELDAERSWNLEIGTRTQPVPGVQLEATAFHLDFTNQIIAASMSGGAAADIRTANQGETTHAGIESGVAVNFGQLAGWPFGLTTTLTHTYVDARFSADRFLQNSLTNQLVNVRDNRLPYAPEHTLAWGVALAHPGHGTLRLDGVRVSEQFGDNFETVAGTANGRIGQIPAYSVLDLSGTYRLPFGGFEVIGSVKNLTDRSYIASRRPQGIKPGLPRTVSIGARVAF